MTYQEAITMDDDERYGVLVALRELNGWTYLGEGKWKEPDWIVQARALEKKSGRK